MKFPSNEYRFPFFESGGIVLYLTLTIRPLDTARVPGSLEARIYKPATRVVLPPPPPCARAFHAQGKYKPFHDDGKRIRRCWSRVQLDPICQ